MSKRNIVVAVYEVEGFDDSEVDEATGRLCDELQLVPDDFIEQTITMARKGDRPIPSLSVNAIKIA